MKMLEVFPIAMLSTAAAVVTWFVFFQYTDIDLFSSYYSIFIFPVLFGSISILIYKKMRG